MKKELFIRFNLNGSVTLFGTNVEPICFQTVSSCRDFLEKNGLDVDTNNIQTQRS